MKPKSPPKSDDWSSGAIVSVSRLAGQGQAMARPMGIGEMLGPIRVGEVVRIRLDEGRALAPTVVIRIESIAPDVIRFDTRNHRYELRRIAASPSAMALLAIHDEAPVDDEPLDARTRIIRVDEWPPEEDPKDRFTSGARIRLTRERRDRRDTGMDLGDAILLTALRPGQVASFSTCEGVIGTSEIREIRHLDKQRIEVLTANSRYCLERLSDPGTD